MTKEDLAEIIIKFVGSDNESGCYLAAEKILNLIVMGGKFEVGAFKQCPYRNMLSPDNRYCLGPLCSAYEQEKEQRFSYIGKTLTIFPRCSLLKVDNPFKVV